MGSSGVCIVANEPAGESIISGTLVGEVMVIVEAASVTLIKLPGPNTRLAVSKVMATAGTATVPAA